MTKHVITYHDNYEIKRSTEYKDDKIVIVDEYDIDGRLLYKESDEVLAIFEHYPDGKSLYFIENKIKNTWERKLYDSDDNELLCEWSNGSWCEHRYDENGNKKFFINSFGRIHYHEKDGIVIYEEFDDPELLCSFELNFIKTPNKFV